MLYEVNDNIFLCREAIEAEKFNHNNRCWQGFGGKRNPHTLLVGMQASATTLENNMEAS